MDVEIEAPGAECEHVLAAPDCLNLLEKIENGTLPSAVSIFYLHCFFRFLSLFSLCCGGDLRQGYTPT